MIAAAIPARRAAIPAWATAGVLLAALAVIVGVRALALRAGLDGLAIGMVFGLVMLGVASWGTPPAPWRARAASPRLAMNLSIGVMFGLALVVVTIAGATLAGREHVPGLGRPAAPFAPWLVITLLVATAEEALLRGRLFDAVVRAGGTLPAVAITTIAFALMHVPAYGWHVVPLDLAVGVGLAGLRIVMRGVAAPAAAHAVADVATWWL